MADRISDQLKAAFDAVGIKWPTEKPPVIPELRVVDYTTIQTPDWLDKYYLDPAANAYQARARLQEKTLVDFPDHEMVMEMIRRGYAVMKLPKDGGPPEVLRNAQPE